MIPVKYARPVEFPLAQTDFFTKWVFFRYFFHQLIADLKRINVLCFAYVLMVVTG